MGPAKKTPMTCWWVSAGSGQNRGLRKIFKVSPLCYLLTPQLEFVKLYKHTTGSQIVEPAHMEIAEPSIEQAVGEQWTSSVQFVRCVWLQMVFNRFR